MLEERINQDLKAALLGGDKQLSTLLRGLKSSLLYAKIAAGSRDRAMEDTEIQSVLRKEVKKRRESAELYARGGEHGRADAELQEAAVIEHYLPAEPTEADITRLVDDAITQAGGVEKSTMGIIISKVKSVTNGAVDGAVLARIVKERLEGNR